MVVFFIHNAKLLIPDKAGPFVRRARKAAGLVRKMAELPKEKLSECSAFLFWAMVKGGVQHVFDGYDWTGAAS